MTCPEGFTSRQWSAYVKRGRALVQKKTDAQFQLGDLCLEMVPKQRKEFADHGVTRVLEAFADQIGLSPRTLQKYRQVAMAWPVDRRAPGVSFSVHVIFAPQPNRFRKILNPPIDPVSGERRWTVNEAERAVGQTPHHPVSREERVDRVRDLLPRHEDAALAVKDMLRRPEVAEQVVADPSARHILHRAEMSRYQQRREAEPIISEPPRQREPALHYSEAGREVLELLGICTTFYTQMQRVVPSLHVAEYDRKATQTLLDNINRVRAAADWCETVIKTGDTTMDEALARLLEGET